MEEEGEGGERRRGEEETRITLGNRVIIARLLVKEVENYARHQRRMKDRETRANCFSPIFTPPLWGSLCQGSRYANERARKVGEFRGNCCALYWMSLT